MPDSTFTINRNAVSNIEKRTHQVLFEHLETYARAVGVPQPALSFVSRYQYASIEEARRVVDALNFVVTEAEQRSNRKLNVYDLETVRELVGWEPKTDDLLAIPLSTAEKNSMVERLRTRKDKIGDNSDSLVADTPLWRASN